MTEHEFERLCGVWRTPTKVQVTYALYGHGPHLEHYDLWDAEAHRAWDANEKLGLQILSIIPMIEFLSVLDAIHLDDIRESARKAPIIGSGVSKK